MVVSEDLFFWDMTPCNLVQIYWKFIDNYWHNLSWWNSPLEFGLLNLIRKEFVGRVIRRVNSAVWAWVPLWLTVSWRSSHG